MPCKKHASLGKSSFCLYPRVHAQRYFLRRVLLLLLCMNHHHPPLSSKKYMISANLKLAFLLSLKNFDVKQLQQNSASRSESHRGENCQCKSCEVDTIDQWNRSGHILLREPAQGLSGFHKAVPFPGEHTSGYKIANWPLFKARLITRHRLSREVMGQRGASLGAEGQFYSIPEAQGMCVLRKPFRHMVYPAIISVVTAEISRKRSCAHVSHPQQRCKRSSRDSPGRRVLGRSGSQFVNVAPMLDIAPSSFSMTPPLCSPPLWGLHTLALGLGFHTKRTTPSR